jgi:F-type H+-transporting ATPase subunit epsilon
MSFQCVIVTPERQLLDDTVESAVLPAFDGQVGILDNRAPLLAQLGEGPLVVRRGGAEQQYYVEGGVAQMKDNKLTILTDDAMPVADIDAAAAKQQLDDATKSVATDDATQARKEQRMRRARAKLALAS